jgi:hypothetical protein
MQAVLAAADAVVAAIDQTELAIFLGQRPTDEGSAAAKHKKGEKAVPGLVLGHW